MLASKLQLKVRLLRRDDIVTVNRIGLLQRIMLKRQVFLPNQVRQYMALWEISMDVWLTKYKMPFTNDL